MTRKWQNTCKPASSIIYYNVINNQRRHSTYTTFFNGFKQVFLQLSYIISSFYHRVFKRLKNAWIKIFGYELMENRVVTKKAKLLRAVILREFEYHHILIWFNYHDLLIIISNILSELAVNGPVHIGQITLILLSWCSNYFAPPLIC